MTVFDSGETTALAQAFERAVEAHRAGQTAAAIAGYEGVLTQARNSLKDPPCT